MTKRLIHLVPLVLLLLLVSCEGGTSWPPVVTTVKDIKALPADTTSVRGIGVGDAEVRAVAERLKSLDYLYLNSKSPITDSGAAAISDLASLRQLVIENGLNHDRCQYGGLCIATRAG